MKTFKRFITEGYEIWFTGTVGELLKKPGYTYKWNAGQPPSSSTRVQVVTRDDGEEDDADGPMYVETATDNPRMLGRAFKK
jgi:hypothetical protein